MSTLQKGSAPKNQIEPFGSMFWSAKRISWSAVSVVILPRGCFSLSL